MPLPSIYDTESQSRCCSLLPCLCGCALGGIRCTLPPKAATPSPPVLPHPANDLRACFSFRRSSPRPLLPVLSQRRRTLPLAAHAGERSPPARGRRGAGARRLARGERRNGGRRGESRCCRLAWASIHVSMGRAGRKLGVAPGAGRKGGPAPGSRRGERGERRRPARRQNGGRNEKMPLDCELILLKFKGFFEKWQWLVRSKPFTGRSDG